MELTRRQFLGTSSAAMVAGAMAKSTVFGANDRVNVALIGCGNRGRVVAGGMINNGARLTHLCDLHPERLEVTWDNLSHEQDERPAFVQNMDEVFASDEVDAVIVATPDHWHALPSIRGVQAGKDVYVEKPHSHSIHESRKMVEAAEQHGRFIEVGMQNRSAEYVHTARERIRDGELGQIPMVKVYGRALLASPFHLGEPSEPPEGFDWNTWLGRVPTEWDYYPRLFNHGWHNLWEFNAAGQAIDGVHQLDMALMLMDDPGIPKSVRSIAGQYVQPDDDSEIPDFESVSWDFGDFIMTLETIGAREYMRMQPIPVPYWPMNATRIELYGEERFMYAGRHARGVRILERDGEEIETLEGNPGPTGYGCWDHFANFLNCVRTREKPTADISLAHASNVMIHMANIAHRLGNISLNYDAETGEFDNDEANAMIRPPEREEFAVPDEV
ncbi:MAG: Gfo/Idh/MocA family protein [Candidatus Hydrogenedentota bacterium]